MTRRLSYMIFLPAGLASAVPAVAQRFVDANATGPGTHDGSTWRLAYVDLQAALTTPPLPTVVWVANGTYYPTSGTSRSAAFSVPGGVRVYGGFRGVDDPNDPNDVGESLLSQRDETANETILDGNIGDPNGATDNSYHVVKLDAGLYTNTKLSGFTIQNGYANGSGDDALGGGILLDLEDEGVSLNRLRIIDNYAEDGGGGACVKGRFFTYWANCRFESNLAANGDGGGALLLPLTLTLGQAEFQNCEFLRNESPKGSGGGAAVSNSQKLKIFFVNCTFTENDAETGGGGGIYSALASEFSTTSILNSILWQNSEPEYVSVSNSATDVQYCDIQNLDPNLPGSNFDADPQFRHVASGNLRLRYSLTTCSSTSPRFDRGKDDLIRLDFSDVNDDTILLQETPWDAKRGPRVIDFLSDSDPNTTVEVGSLEECPGDISGDGAVGLPDLAILLACFGTTSCSGVCCNADIANCDSQVTLPDLSALLVIFGDPCELGEGGGGDGFAPPGDGGEGDSGDDDPFVQWLRSRTVNELLDWYRDGMPR